MNTKLLPVKSTAVLVVLLFMNLLASAQEAKRTVPTDGEKKTTTKKVVKKKPASTEKAKELPSLEDRLFEQRAAIRKGEEREPTAPYLIDEIFVNGIYKSREGF